MDTLKINEKDASLPDLGIFKEVRTQAGDWERLLRLGFGNLILDTETRRILVKGNLQSPDDTQHTVSLSPFETEILRLLLLLTNTKERHGRIVSTEEIRDWLDQRIRMPRGGDDALLDNMESERNIINLLQQKLRGLQGCDVRLVNNPHRGFQLVLA